MDWSRRTGDLRRSFGLAPGDAGSEGMVGDPSRQEDEIDSLHVFSIFPDRCPHEHKPMRKEVRRWHWQAFYAWQIIRYTFFFNPAPMPLLFLDARHDYLYDLEFGPLCR